MWIDGRVGYLEALLELVEISRAFAVTGARDV
jgi:hypothetical protein